MKALVFDLSMARALCLRVFGAVKPSLYYRGPLSMLSLVDAPEPALPGPDWVRIRTRMCGFCGSDMNLMFLKDSPMASPFTSFPAIIGHEVCGEVVETGSGVRSCRTGDLVAVDPMLGCAPRGIATQCRACRAGRHANCENHAAGGLAPGMFMGLCRDRGGGFAECLVAHAERVFRVPEGVSAESAALVEPFAVALQAVLDNRPADREKVLVVGGGVIGVMVVKALRGLGIGCHVSVIEPQPFAAEFARKAGADHVTAESITRTAGRVTGAAPFKPVLGKAVLQGGFDRVFDTVGHSNTIQDSLLAAAAGGTVCLVGISSRVAFDPTPLWLKLQTIRGCYAYGYTDTGSGRKHTFETALELMRDRKVAVEDMLTHVFPIEKYQDLIEVNLNKGVNRAMKTAVRF